MNPRQREVVERIRAKLAKTDGLPRVNKFEDEEVATLLQVIDMMAWNEFWESRHEPRGTLLQEAAEAHRLGDQAWRLAHEVGLVASHRLGVLSGALKYHGDKLLRLAREMKKEGADGVSKPAKSGQNPAD